MFRVTLFKYLFCLHVKKKVKITEIIMLWKH